MMLKRIIITGVLSIALLGITSSVGLGDSHSSTANDVNRSNNEVAINDGPTIPGQGAGLGNVGSLQPPTVGFKGTMAGGGPPALFL